MDVEAYCKDSFLGKSRIYSIGGGSVLFEGEEFKAEADVYPLNTFTQIADYCAKSNKRIWEYVLECEGEEIFDYLHRVWEIMKASINKGLTTKGILPGGLETERRAQILYNQRHIDESAQTKENRLVCSYKCKKL